MADSRHTEEPSGRCPSRSPLFPKHGDRAGTGGVLRVFAFGEKMLAPPDNESQYHATGHTIAQGELVALIAEAQAEIERAWTAVQGAWRATSAAASALREVRR